jgi:hypothetical protein
MSAPRPAAAPAPGGSRGGRFEFVAAALVVVVLLAGAWRVFQQNQQRGSAAAPASRGEEALRAAFDVLEPELRMEGGFGLTSRAEFIAGSAGPDDPPGAVDAAVAGDCGPNFVADLARPLEVRHGYELACPGLRPAAWSDVVIVRRASGAVRSAGGGGVWLRTTRLGGALELPGPTAGAGRADSRAEGHELEVSAYYIGADAPNPREWSLRRQRLGRGADGRPAMLDEALVRGVVDLQAVLGVDTDGDGAVDVYVRPGAPELARGRIVSVRIALTAFADDPEVPPATPSNAREALPAGGWRRLVLERTVALRNAGSD